jgi:hypothetical protein
VRKLTIQNPFKKEARASVATKKGTAAAISTDCISAAKTPRKR